MRSEVASQLVCASACSRCSSNGSYSAVCPLCSTRQVQAGELRRIDRGLYDRPSLNRLTKRPTSPDYRAVVEAITRRDHLRLLVDGMTAANDAYAHGGRLATMDQKLTTEVVPGRKKALELSRI